MVLFASKICQELRFAAAIFAASSLLAGCLSGGSATGPAPQTTQDATGINALQERPASHPGVPSGCTLEAGAAGQDSVLNCPDVRPPKPR